MQVIRLTHDASSLLLSDTPTPRFDTLLLGEGGAASANRGGRLQPGARSATGPGGGSGAGHGSGEVKAVASDEGSGEDSDDASCDDEGDEADCAYVPSMLQRGRPGNAAPRAERGGTRAVDQPAAATAGSTESAQDGGSGSAAGAPNGGAAESTSTADHNQLALSGAADGREAWGVGAAASAATDVEPFALDPDFDYDNIQLTHKTSRHEAMREWQASRGSS